MTGMSGRGLFDPVQSREQAAVTVRNRRMPSCGYSRLQRLLQSHIGSPKMSGVLRRRQDHSGRTGSSTLWRWLLNYDSRVPLL